MTTSSPITQGSECRLFTHKDYAIEMMGSIIRDKDVDPCAKLGIDKLGASSLFDLAWLCFFHFSCSFVCLVADSYYFVGVGADESFAR